MVEKDINRETTEVVTTVKQNDHIEELFYGKAAPTCEYDYAAEDAAIQRLIDGAPEPLKALVNYYNAISPIPQPLFAVSSSLISASVVLSRNWQTDRLEYDVMSMEPSTLNDYHVFLAPTGFHHE